MAAKTFLKTTLTMVILLFVVSPSNAASLQPVGHLEGGTTYGNTHSVSADGLVVVGHGVSAFGREAFRWENGVMIGLGDLPGGVFSSEAYDVSADGSVVVGESVAASGYEAFRWENGVMTGLGDLPGGEFRSNAIAVSADGLVIVGSSDSATSYQAVRWENGIMKGLGYLAGGAYSHARGISADGSVVVGNSDSSYGRVAFRWENGTMTGLGDLPGGSVWSIATDVSDDGSVVVGASYSGSGREAIRWTASTGIVALGVLPGGYYNSFAHAVSADGSVVVGISGDRAFIWDQINGMRNLKELLESKYRLELTGWSLYSAKGISADGLTIVGNGCGPEGCEDWIAVLSKPEPAVIYVDDEAAGANNGSSWADAYNYLQNALNAAWPGDEIHVAQGIYKPDQGDAVTPGDRKATFQLINGVTIKGGYAGLGQPKPNTRDIQLYETILSGDLDGNDIPVDWYTKRENSYHVVTGSGTAPSAVIQGFIIAHGNAYDPDNPVTNGGGMLNENGSPTIMDCTFFNNSRGGIYNYKSSPKITDCTFSNNSASEGGGMYNNESSPTMISCTFSNNSAGSGGGMSNWFCDDLMIIDCTFSGNFVGADCQGGGMSNAYSHPTLINCSFIGNSTDKDSDGGAMVNWHSNPNLTNCTFTGNSAEKAGGMYNRYSNPILDNCTFSSNFAERSSGGMYNLECNPTLVNCIFTYNEAGYRGGGMYNYGSSPILTNCTFNGNQSGDDGGGMYNHELSLECNPQLTNCTFTGNRSDKVGGGMCNDNSSPTLINCILWGDTAADWPEIHGSCLVSYSDVEGGWIGEGNIDEDPCFVKADYWDANGILIEGDYHLLPASPCIDAGDPDYIAEPNETDLDGNPRVIGGRIDMGAYEYSPPIPSDVDIEPDTLNLTSKGKWITCYIWLPEEYNVADIDPNSIFLDDEIQPEKFWLTEDNQVAIVKFNREQVQAILDIGEVELTITGQLTDGTVFEGTDTIKVIDKAGKK